ncbi:Carbohydrate esterase 4 protein [Modicella reniformis]|uniref:Carbohydrate esterase 4 protein n=1 Tax=Modicella reniformis TaxID=1440133 RepID=A0A9P6III8_9FUNG|nr:Carbohydrate esterase 4 protein [Modicella reniformis]
MSIVFQFRRKNAFRFAFLVAMTLLATASVSSARMVKRRPSSLPQVITACTKSKTVALTFDDGPYIYAYDVAKALDAVGAKGTFFLNGDNYVNIYDPDPRKTAKYLFDKGHQIASHTWSHPHLIKLNRNQIVDEFKKIDDAIYEILKVRPAFMRPPYGEYNDLVLSVAQERGQRVVTWDFDTKDSIGATPADSKKAIDKIARNPPKNILMLMHETIETTVHQVLPHAIQVLKNAGYSFVTVADCLGLPAYQKI